MTRLKDQFQISSRIIWFEKLRINADVVQWTSISDLHSEDTGSIPVIGANFEVVEEWLTHFPVTEETAGSSPVGFAIVVRSYTFMPG